MYEEKEQMDGYGMSGIANSLEPLITKFRDNLISVGDSVIKTMKTVRKKKPQRGGSKAKSTKKVKKKAQRGAGRIQKRSVKKKAPQRGAGKRKQKKRKPNF
jgi:hypothetical protein